MALCSSPCCQGDDATESVLANSLPTTADPFREELESRVTAAAVAFQEEKRPLCKDKANSFIRVKDPEADVEALEAKPEPVQEKANAFRLPAEKTTTWVYKPINGKMIEVRVFPTCSNGRDDRAGHRVIPDEAFDVEEERLATQDGERILYLKLADGRGWLFDQKPGIGVMCVRQDGSDPLPPLSGVLPPAGGVPDLAKAAQDGSKPFPPLSGVAHPAGGVPEEPKAAEADLAGAQGGAGDVPQAALWVGKKACTGSPDRV